jgi:hypothetical protein
MKEANTLSDVCDKIDKIIADAEEQGSAWFRLGRESGVPEDLVGVAGGNYHDPGTWSPFQFGKDIAGARYFIYRPLADKLVTYFDRNGVGQNNNFSETEIITMIGGVRPSPPPTTAPLPVR